MADEDKRPRSARAGEVRETDIEPYTALRWVGTLFKSAAVFLAVAIVAEFIAGLRIGGMAALPLLMGELARTIVLAVALWGAGDLAKLLIHVGHDIRAQRVLLARVAHRLKTGEEEAPVEVEEEVAVRERPERPPERRHPSEIPNGPEAAAD